MTPNIGPGPPWTSINDNSLTTKGVCIMVKISNLFNFDVFTPRYPPFKTGALVSNGYLDLICQKAFFERKRCKNGQDVRDRVAISRIWPP